MWDSAAHLAIVLFILLILCIPYFIPSIIAFHKRKTNRGAILALNIFLGWSLIGWVVALVWALKVEPSDRRVP
jgi:Superinfection immunity protein